MSLAFCTVADNNFYEGVKILIYSLYKNIPNFLEYDFIIFVSDLINVKLSEDKIIELKKNFKNIKIKEINVEEYLLGHVLVPTQRASFLTIESFNLNYDKIIFIDSDILCLNNILNVFDSKFELSVCGGRQNDNKVGNNIHFNAGVLFINNMKNKDKYYKDLLNIVKNKPKTGINTDQWCLNYYFNNIIKLERKMIPQIYNYRDWGGIPISNDVIVDNPNYIKSNQDLDKIMLLHFSGYMKRLKPWNSLTKKSDLLAYKIWWKYHNMYETEFNIVN